MKLGEKIRVFRLTKGHSQETMADALGLSVTGYGKIERGETELTVLRLEQIATVLVVSMEAILKFNETTTLRNQPNSYVPSFESVKHDNIHNDTLSMLIAAYESRIKRLEDDISEVRRLLFETLRKT